MDLWTQKCRAEKKNRLSAAELERLENGESTARECKMGKARIAKNGGEGGGGGSVAVVAVVAVMEAVAVVAVVARVLRRWMVEVELV